MNYTWTIKNVFLTEVGSEPPVITEEDVATPNEMTGEDIIKTQTKTVEGTEHTLSKFIQSIDVEIKGSEGGKESVFKTTAHLYHNPENSYKAFDDVETADLISWAKSALGDGVIDNIKAQLKREVDAMSSATGRQEWSK
tara:strand:+ start:58 stop:474 length:417 start_codon:yes stop_codon:yes gene_type:complete